MRIIFLSFAKISNTTLHLIKKFTQAKINSMYKEQMTLKAFGKFLQVLPAMIFFLSLLVPLTSFSEEISYAKTRAALVEKLKKTYIDKAYSQNIEHFYFTTCDSLIKKKLKIEDKPIKDILTKLFDVSNSNLNSGSITSLGIPSINHIFLLTLKTYKKGSIRNLYMGINYKQSNILRSVFEGFSLGDTIRDIVGLREMFFEPYFISSRIKLPQYASYKDTLLYEMANVAPEILNMKIADNDTFYTALVNKTDKMSVKAIAAVKKDTYYDRMLPFSLAMHENRITAEEIKKLTLVPQEYYHAFVEEAIRLHTNKNPEISIFLKEPITELNAKFGNYYFIKQINDLHELPDNTRFKVVSTLPAKELYFLLLAGSYELTQEGASALYTSSFLHLYKKFLKETEKGGLNNFFEEINYYQFSIFISNVSDYGLVADLVNNLNEEKFTQFLVTYLESIPSKQLTDNEIILDAMTMAEILYEIRNHPTLKNNVIENIVRIEKQPRLQNQLIYQRIYQVYKDILMDKYKYEADNTYDVLKVKRLQKQSPIVQVSFFYDDDDATASFASSVATYNAKMWDKKDMGSYIFFSSKVGNKMKVYMNKPKTKEGCDTAQDVMLQAIEKEGYEITSFIHRGHSYHLPQSLRKMTESCQFAFLGSCGGYKQVLKVFQLNPDANIIATRSVGSKFINDPLLERINTDIVNNKDINWDALWAETGSKFQSKLTKDLFAGYTPPNKYVGIKFIRKVFNY